MMISILVEYINVSSELISCVGVHCHGVTWCCLDRLVIYG